MENVLVQMHAKCGTLDEAMDVFANMHRRNVASWNLIITKFTQQWQGQEGSKLFDRMQQEGVLPNKVTFICMLSAYASREVLDSGKRMHARIHNNGLAADAVKGTALLNMYGKCGDVEEARNIFNILQDRDVISWNAMMAIHAKHNQVEQSFILFHQMQLEGVMPNNVTFVSMLDACARQGSIIEGKWMHRCIVDVGLQTDVVVGTAIANMYGKCGSLVEASNMFESLQGRDIVAWNVMIALYAHRGHGTQAIELFNQMLHEGLMPNKVTLVSVLDVCASQTAVAAGKRIHSCVIGSGFKDDLVVGNAIINMYGKCGRLEDAHNMLEKMCKRNVVSWTAMIAAYSHNGQGEKALQSFNEMLVEGVTPNGVTFISVLDACACQTALAKGKWIHECILGNGFEPDVIVGTALVNMYGKCGSLEDARRLFERLPRRDMFCWTAMIALYVHHGQEREALYLFDQMQRDGIMPDKVMFTNILSASSGQVALTEVEDMCAATQRYGLELDDVVGCVLISMYGGCGEFNLAQKVFDQAPKQDAKIWNAMIVVYVQHVQGKKALQLFEQMSSAGISPDKVTFVSTLAACTSQTALAEGGRLHTCILSSGFDLDEAVVSAVVSMYGKCGSLKSAWKVFENIQKKGMLSWNSIIGVFSQHGEGIEAVRLVAQMQQGGLVPDMITLVSVLIACSHAGLINEGCCYFDSMEHAFCIFPIVDHCVCMVDMFGRAGQLDEAESMIDKMPFQPTAVSFMSLLGASRYLVDIERSERAAKQMLELNPEDAAPYIMMSNIYAATSRGMMEQRCS